MAKKNFITLVLAVIGGLLFSVGMCMCLLPEWNAFKPGVICASVGFTLLLTLFIVRWKMDGRKFVKPNWRKVFITLYSVISTLILGTGMCMIMVWDMALTGIIVGVIGILMLLFIIPIVKGLK